MFNGTAQAFERLGIMLAASECADVIDFDAPRLGPASGMSWQTTEPIDRAGYPSSQDPVAKRDRAYPTRGLLAM